MLRSVVALVLLVCLVEGVVLPFLHMPKHDGVKRVCSLSAENFTSVVSGAEIAVVIFADTPTQPKATCSCGLEIFGEEIAQLVRKKNYIVCKATPDVVNVGKPVQEAVKSGDVYIYKKGRGIPYHGKRATEALLNYLFKVNGTQVNIITGKIDKIAFDAVQQTKVIGFFMQGTADHQAYEEAAALLSPSVSFYAAFDRVVAKHLKLTTVGEIHLVDPFSKLPVVCPQNPATVADIEAFLKGSRGAVLRKINEYDLYDPLLTDSTKILVLAIGEELSPQGGYFHHLITKLIATNRNNTEFDMLNIVWVEPKLFPNIYLVMDELQTTLGIPNKLPAFGALNVTTMQSSWMDTTTMNYTSDKLSDAANLLLLQNFLTGVMTNTIIPVKIGVQSFVTVPVSQTVAEDTQVTLECVVENPVGDCLWLKDGRNIGFNLNRYPHYNWRGDRLAGDCSLVITGVQANRDSGEWVCEVTGDHDNPTLSSTPAKLLVTASATGTIKTEL